MLLPYNADISSLQVAARQVNAGKATQESLVHPACLHLSQSTSGLIP